MNVVDEISEPHRGVFIAVLERMNPELLALLRGSTLPTVEEWKAVVNTMGDAFSEHLGPGHEPDAEGVRIDNALGAFLLRWPNDRLAEPEG